MCELDHFLKGLFRILEVFNFMDWSLGALAKRTLDEDFISMEDLSSILSCLDKAVRDGSTGTGLLKKRSVFSSFLSKSVSPLQRSSLLYAPLSSHLFPQEISRSLSEKASQDLLAQSSKRMRPAAPIVKKEKAPFQEPFRGTRSFRRRRPERRGRPSGLPVRKSK